MNYDKKCIVWILNRWSVLCIEDFNIDCDKEQMRNLHESFMH